MCQIRGLNTTDEVFSLGEEGGPHHVVNTFSVRAPFFVHFFSIPLVHVSGNQAFHLVVAAPVASLNTHRCLVFSFYMEYLLLHCC